MINISLIVTRTNPFINKVNSVRMVGWCPTAPEFNFHFTTSRISHQWGAREPSRMKWSTADWLTMVWIQTTRVWGFKMWLAVPKRILNYTNNCSIPVVCYTYWMGLSTQKWSSVRTHLMVILCVVLCNSQLIQKKKEQGNRKRELAPDKANYKPTDNAKKKKMNRVQNYSMAWPAELSMQDLYNYRPMGDTS